jgi:hypothetical protein
VTPYREGEADSKSERKQAYFTNPRAFAIAVVAFLAALAFAGRSVLVGEPLMAVLSLAVAALFLFRADAARTLYECNGGYLDIKRGLSRYRTARVHVTPGATVSVVAAGQQSMDDDNRLKMTTVHLVEVVTLAGNKVIAELEDRSTADAVAEVVRTVVGPPSPG